MGFARSWVDCVSSQRWVKRSRSERGHRLESLPLVGLLHRDHVVEDQVAIVIVPIGEPELCLVLLQTFLCRQAGHVLSPGQELLRGGALDQQHDHRPIIGSQGDRIGDRRINAVGLEGRGSGHPTTKLTSLPGTTIDLADRLALEQGGDPLVAAGCGFELRPIGVGRHDNPAPELAVDLHRDLDLVVLQEGRVVGRPGLVGQGPVVAQDLPELLGEVRSERRRAAA